MSVTLAANWRIVSNYVVDGYPHKMRTYCKAQLVSGVYNVANRADAYTIFWEDAADYISNLSCFILKSGGANSLGDSVLENRSGSAWLPVATFTPSGAPASGAAYQKAGQVTVTLRDTSFHKVRVLLMESIVDVGLKFTTLGAITPAGLQDFVDQFLSAAGADTSQPYNWMRSRGNLLLGTSPLVSVVTDLNDKLRRGRFIA